MYRKMAYIDIYIYIFVGESIETNWYAKVSIYLFIEQFKFDGTGRKQSKTVNVIVSLCLWT